MLAYYLHDMHHSAPFCTTCRCLLRMELAVRHQITMSDMSIAVHQRYKTNEAKGWPKGSAFTKL